jgi:4-hydroxybenzoate polyprenyltransferase
MFLHVIFNVTGVAIGFYLAYKVKMPSFGFVFLLVSGILWFYSTTYKRQFLIGNLLVAILTAMVPFMVVLFELPMLNRVYGQVMISYGQNFYLLIYWVLGFSFFAFITTLIREIIKDIEDFEGDRAYGMNTLPVVIGVRWSKAIALALTAMTIGAIIVVYLLYLGDKITLVYLLVMLILPLLVFGVMLIKARETSQFHRASVVLKLIMMTGILYTLVARYNLTVSF